MIALKILYYLLEKNDSVLFKKIDIEWILDARIKDLYKLSSDYLEKRDKLPSITHILEITQDESVFKDIKLLPKDSIEYFIEELEERFNKFTYLDQLYNIINSSDITTFEELISEHQNLLLKAQQTSENQLNEIDCSNSPDPEDLVFKIPLGLPTFDKVNGGIASSELMLLGGFRGTGKSVLALNCAINRFKAGRTAAFISIEMRSVEVCNRIDSIITGVPIKLIEENKLNEEELKQFYERKTIAFCNSSDSEVKKFRKMLDDSYQYTRGELEQIYKRLPRKENKLFLYDLPTCSPTNINYIASKLKLTHNLSLLVVDYLNIIKMPGSNQQDYDPLGWKSQVARSEFLKTTARVNDVAVISPIQISDEGKIKFARAIEDVVDISLLFDKSKSSTSNLLSIRTSKIRNGKEVSFNLIMDSDNLRITEFNKSREVNESN